MLTLREGDDENAQLAALSELCELLAVSSEDALAMFPVDSLVPVLVRLIRGHDTGEPPGRRGGGIRLHSGRVARPGALLAAVAVVSRLGASCNALECIKVA